MSLKSDRKKTKRLAYEIEERINLHNSLALKHSDPIICAVYADKDEDIYQQWEDLMKEKEEDDAECKDVIVEE
jgi:hypothetical protein